MRTLVFLILAGLLVFSSLCFADPFTSSGSNEVLLIPSGVRPPCTGPIKDGVDRQYYSNGKIYDETSCQNGQLHGPSRQYTQEGKLWSLRNFKNGQLDGLATQYTKAGKLVVQSNYKDGQLVEPVLRYDQAWQSLTLQQPVVLLEKAANFVDEDKKLAEFMKTDAYKAASQARQSSPLNAQKRRDLTVERHFAAPAVPAVQSTTPSEGK